MPKILDNIGERLGDELLRTLESSHSLDTAVGYFNLRGWRLIAAAVDDLASGEDEQRPRARVLVGITEDPGAEMRRLAAGRVPQIVDNKTANQLRDDAVAGFRLQLEVGVPTAGDEAALRSLQRQIDGGIVEMRLHTAHRLHAKLYLCHRSDTAAPRVGYVGSSNLTSAGLREQGELSTDVVDGDATAKLAAWFEARWNDPLSIPVHVAVSAAISKSWASETQLDPYLVYPKMAYHLSKEAREGLVQFGLPASMEAELLAFQAAAVKIAARIVMGKGGAMVGDVVGLGKTLVGTAVARLLQEEHGFETLVACPKNLVGMWQDYLHRYEVRGRVVSLSMVHRELPDARRHRLVIVDEAHNLRNEARRDHRALRAYISDNDSRVLLLSATPYNKGLGDLAAQLALFIDPDADLGLRPERAIAAHARGAAGYQHDCGGAELTSLAAFKRSGELADWQALLSQYLMRRTRSFIEEHYTRADETGRRYLTFGSGQRFYFPRRRPVPVEIHMPPGDAAARMASDATLDAIKALRLPRYQLGDYLRHGYRSDDADEQALLEDLATAGRGNLSGFTRIMMYKRLSSSGPAFLATLRRHRLRNLVALHALEAGLPIPVGPVDNALWEAEADWRSDDLDADSGFDTGGPEGASGGSGGGPGGAAMFEPQETAAQRAYDALAAAGSRRVRWAPAEAFLDDLRAELADDTEAISALLGRFGPWDPDRDTKMDALERLITDEHGDEKVLVFTEAADTAHYVAGELARRGVAAVAAVTGSSENPSELARRFSPRSGRASVIGADELRVLVSTDVLSEGQNLQDARIVVNYDLPWAVVRLVQRAGRVDRIGQRAAEVVVYSLLPAGSVEEEIRLRGRIRERLAEQAALLGSDEQFFGDPSERRSLSALYDEHSDFEAADGAEDVDPVSMAYEIWRRASETHPHLAEAAAALPDVVHATKAATAPEAPSPAAAGDAERDTGDATAPQPPTGDTTDAAARPAVAPQPPEAPGDSVVVHSRTVTGSDAFAVVAAADGEARRITPQEALRLAQCEPDEPAAPRLADHHELVAAAIGGPLRHQPGRATGALQGVRGKLWRLIYDHRDAFEDNLLCTAADLHAAHDAVNERPLLESATQRFANALRDRTPADVAALLVELWHDDRLCTAPPDASAQAEPSIICSMGLRHQHPHS
ncbi:MAG: helicase-related protein [bacterium]|nr:helicase-related protein [bacterium]